MIKKSDTARTKRAGLKTASVWRTVHVYGFCVSLHNRMRASRVKHLPCCCPHPGNEQTTAALTPSPPSHQPPHPAHTQSVRCIPSKGACSPPTARKKSIAPGSNRHQHVRLQLCCSSLCRTGGCRPDPTMVLASQPLVLHTFTEQVCERTAAGCTPQRFRSAERGIGQHTTQSVLQAQCRLYSP